MNLRQMLRYYGITLLYSMAILVLVAIVGALDLLSRYFNAYIAAKAFKAVFGGG